MTLAYNNVSQFTGISRYSDLAGMQLAARSAYAYEPGDRLATITYTQGATSLATYSWGWDGADRITQQTIVSRLTTTITSTETSSYGYNFRNELTGATHNGFTLNEGYVYDGTGNRVNAPYGPPDPNNELKFDGTYTYTYDNEGNRTEKRSGATVVGTFNYDHRNRLIRATNGTTVVEYQYDLMDRRILRAVAGGATQRFGYDGDTIALEFDGSNTLTHRYLHGPVIDQVFADERATAPQAGTYWTLTDHLGSVRDVVDNTGTSTKHIKYNSFGERQVSGTGPEVLYSWTGREYDVEADLQYNRARWYDARVGRWLSTDPIGFDAGDSNLYPYVKNQPTTGRDPQGLHPNQFGARDPDQLVKQIRAIEDQYGKSKGRSYQTFDFIHVLTLFLADQDRNVDAGSNFYYVFTKQHKWIDMSHFTYAARYAVKRLVESRGAPKQSTVETFIRAEVAVGGWLVEATQGALNLPILGELLPGSAASAFSPEDLSSNKVGVEFGIALFREIFNNPNRTESVRVSDFLQKALMEFEAIPKTQAPNWNKEGGGMRKLPATERQWQELYMKDRRIILYGW